MSGLPPLMPGLRPPVPGMVPGMVPLPGAPMTLTQQQAMEYEDAKNRDTAAWLRDAKRVLALGAPWFCGAE